MHEPTMRSSDSSSYCFSRGDVAARIGRARVLELITTLKSEYDLKAHRLFGPDETCDTTLAQFGSNSCVILKPKEIDDDNVLIGSPNANIAGSSGGVAFDCGRGRAKGVSNTTAAEIGSHFAYAHRGSRSRPVNPASDRSRGEGPAGHISLPEPPYLDRQRQQIPRTSTSYFLHGHR